MIAQQTICLYIFYFTCVIISPFVMLTLKDHLRSMKILKFRNIAFILLAFAFRTFHLLLFARYICFDSVCYFQGITPAFEN